MLSSTKAIVLHKLNYSETSLVVQVYTLEYGKVGLLLQGVKKRSSKIKPALFEPLSILELTGNFTDLEKLIRPREIKLHIPFNSIQSNILKRTLAIFLSELLHKSIREPVPDQYMFNYIEKALKHLEQTKTNVANFHLGFLIELTKFLGFQPQKSNGNYFNMVEGIFTDSIPSTPSYLQGEDKDLFLRLLGTNFVNCADLHINSIQRKKILSFIILYYQTHIPKLSEIKSHTILEAIFI